MRQLQRERQMAGIGIGRAGDLPPEARRLCLGDRSTIAASFQCEHGVGDLRCRLTSDDEIQSALLPALLARPCGDTRGASTALYISHDLPSVAPQQTNG